MNRREWMKTTAAAGAAMALGSGLEAETFGNSGAQSSGTTKFESQIRRLKLRHTWTTTMSSSEFRDTLFVNLTREGVTGVGEGAPIVRYHEDAIGGQKALDGVRALLTEADPWKYEKVMEEVNRRVEGQFAAKAAVDIALMDWV